MLKIKVQLCRRLAAEHGNLDVDFFRVGIDALNDTNEAFERTGYDLHIVAHGVIQLGLTHIHAQFVHLFICEGNGLGRRSHEARDAGPSGRVSVRSMSSGGV